MERIELVRPKMALADAYLDYCAELVAEHSGLQGLLAQTTDDVRREVSACELREHHGDESTDHIPQTSYWVVRNGTDVIGNCQLWHYLKESAKVQSGHLNYGLRSSERGKGYGTQMLALLIEEARALGITRLIITCRKNNLSSRRIIEKNGGMMETEFTNAAGKPWLRYRVDL